jgi:histone deacetylase 1/2
MVRDFPYLILAIQKYITHIVRSLYLMSYMFLQSRNLCFLFRNCLDNNVYFEFHPFLFYVKDLNTNEVLLSGQSKDDLYTLSRFGSSVPSIPQAYWSPCISASADLWHRRLGHPNSDIFQFLVSKNKIICNNKRLNFQCQSCPLEKSSRLPLRPTGHKTSAPLELIFSDVWGPAPLFSSDGYRYFVIFVDAHTKYIWYYPLDYSHIKYIWLYSTGRHWLF